MKEGNLKFNNEPGDGLAQTDTILGKLKEYLKYLVLSIAIDSSLNATEIKAWEEGTDQIQEIQMNSDINNAFKNLSEKNKIAYTTQIGCKGFPLMVDIAQVHASRTNEVEVADTVSSQRNIEKLVQEIINYAKIHHLKVFIYNEGHVSDSSPQEQLQAIIPRIANSFLKPDSDNNTFEDYIERVYKTIAGMPDYYKSSYEYGIWMSLNRYLDDNPDVGNDDKRKELNTLAEGKLKGIDIDKVYYGGAISKMIWDGTIDLNIYKKAEDGDVMNNNFNALFTTENGVSRNQDEVLTQKLFRIADHESPEYQYLVESIRKNRELVKSTMKARENAVIGHIVNDFQESQMDIALIVFGAAHDFTDNVKEFNNKAETKYGLIRFDTRP